MNVVNELFLAVSQPHARAVYLCVECHAINVHTRPGTAALVHKPNCPCAGTTPDVYRTPVLLVAHGAK